jgi:dipeptidyl-peptidase 4
MRKPILLTIALFTFSLAGSQTKMFTMEDAVIGARTYLLPPRPVALQFIPGTQDYSYVEKIGGEETLLRLNAEKNEKKPVATYSQLSQKIKAAKGSGQFWMGGIKWKSADVFGISAGGYNYEINAARLEIIKTDKAADEFENADRLESNGRIAYTVKNNLFIHDKDKEIQVTDEKNPGIVFGASNVHRNEFGISKGTFWSPSGNAIAFYRMDQSMVKDYPVIKWSESPAAECTYVKYPMAGGTSHQVSLGVYNLKTKSTVYLKTQGPDDHYLTNIAWSPDEKLIYIAELNRDQNEMKFNEYDAVTGSFNRTLFEEKDEKYVEPLNPMLFVKNNPAQFIWQSRKDGFNHLYLYDVSGKMLKQLTAGNWEVVSVEGFDDKGEKLFYHATAVSPVDKDFYSVNLKTGKSERITSGDGTHNCQVNDAGNFVLDDFTNVTTPGIYSVINLKTKKTSEIMKAANPIKDFALGNVNLFTIKNKQGTPLWCRMYLPTNFDSSKKYPVIVYLYGGPHHQEVTNVWDGSWNLWYQYMAQRGYIVFSLDNRGTGNRGKAFEQATFRNLGTAEMEDQLAGVDFLKSLSYVDANRMGVHGWSFGGFMTTSLMTRKPGTFKVGVGGGPVIDWKMYEVMYTERYMDSPQTNPEGFSNSCLFQYLPSLKGKLLLIHGTDDDVVVWQHSVKYLKEAVDKGVQLDYFVYPGHPHNVRGKDRVHLMNKVTNYFVEHL